MMTPSCKWPRCLTSPPTSAPPSPSRPQERLPGSTPAVWAPSTPPETSPTGARCSNTRPLAAISLFVLMIIDIILDGNPTFLVTINVVGSSRRTRIHTKEYQVSAVRVPRASGQIMPGLGTVRCEILRTGNIVGIEGGMILKQYYGNLWSRVPHNQVLYNIF